MWSYAFANSTTRQKDRRQKRAHSVSSFCFYWISNHSHCEWFPQSLLDFLESRVMKISGYEKRRLETNHWTGVTQRTWHKSCGYFGKQNFTVRSFAFLPFRVQLYRMWAKALIGDDGSRFCRKRSEKPCGQNTKGLSLCFCELNFTQKNQHTSLKLVCCSFFLSYRTTERAIRATVWRTPRIATDNA